MKVRKYLVNRSIIYTQAVFVEAESPEDAWVKACYKQEGTLVGVPVPDKLPGVEELPDDYTVPTS